MDTVGATLDGALAFVAPVVGEGIRIAPAVSVGAAVGVGAAANDEIAVGVAATVGTSMIGFFGGDWTMRL